MRRLVGFAVLLTLGAGCATRTSGAAATATGIAILGTAVIVAASPDESSSQGDGVDFQYDFDFTPVVAGGLAVIGVGLTIAGVVGLTSDPPEDDAAVGSPASVRVDGRGNDLDRLALAAVAAAQRGDCDIARSYALGIQQRDRAYYQAQIVSEPAVRRCLE